MSITPTVFFKNLDELLQGETPLEKALELTLQTLGADSGTLHLRQGEFLHLKASSKGLPAPVLDKIREIPIGKGMAGLAAERKEPVTTCNLQQDTSGDVRPGAKATGLAGSICVPCLFEGEVVGTLGVANQKERDFTPEETDLLLETARRIGVLAQKGSI